MDSVALWFDEEEENRQNERIHRRILGSKSDILSLNEKSFIKNFMLNKEAFAYVLNNISSEFNTTKSSAIPSIIKLAAALKFLGQGGYQHQIGQDHYLGISQTTMSRCLAEVCKAIEKILCPKHIQFEMSEEEKKEAKSFFFRKSNIPGVIGVVDGTHIQMIRPSENEHLFFNRKLKHSMNAMVICDHKMIIRAVDCKFGGASHDSHVWNVSKERRVLKTQYDNGIRGTWIIGDSGYPLEPWILTPYRNAADASTEALFNEKFSKARSLIERVFGVMKGRFRCLLAARALHYDPKRVVRIMNVCCALHNICCKFKVELLLEETTSTEDMPQYNTHNTPENNNTSSNNNYTNIARNIRDEIKNSMI